MARPDVGGDRMNTNTKLSAIKGMIYTIALALILTVYGGKDVVNWLYFVIIVCVLAIVFLFSALARSGDCSKEEGYE